MKILITGITGLIGNHLMHVLLKNEIKNIKGTYHSSRDLEEYITKNIEIVKADISNENDINNLCEGCQIVVHTAARVIDFGTKQQFYEAHLEATHYLLKDALLHNVEHFIYVSSVGVASGINRNKIIPNETTPLVKTGIHYDDAKIDTEKLVIDFCTKNDIKYTIVRPSAVIGKNSVWIVEPLKRMDTEIGLKLIDNGKQPACLIDAENLATGIYSCIINKNAWNQIYFFMDDWNISWKQYFSDLAKMKNKKIGSSIPFSLAYTVATLAEKVFPIFGKNPPIAKKSVQATGSNRVVSTQKARTELGWSSIITYQESMCRIQDSLK